jgi:hypothetical protein
METLKGRDAETAVHLSNVLLAKVRREQRAGREIPNLDQFLKIEAAKAECSAKVTDFAIAATKRDLAGT